VGTQVFAGATASGGSPPYTYQWSGSAPAVSTNGGAAISYTPVTRIGPPPLAIVYLSSNLSVNVLWPYPSTGFVLESTTNLTVQQWSQVSTQVQTNAGSQGFNLVALPSAVPKTFLRLRLATNTLPVTETVGVTVTDANGVRVHTNVTFAAQAQPVSLAIGLRDPPSYGTESPYAGTIYDTADFSSDTVNWLGAMSGTGAASYTNLGLNSTPGDFVNSSPFFGLVQLLSSRPQNNNITQFMFACGDVSGVNTANLVLYSGHGGPGAFSFTWPGAAAPQSVSQGVSSISEGYNNMNPLSDWGALFLGLFANSPESCCFQYDFDLTNMSNGWGNFPVQTLILKNYSSPYALTDCLNWLVFDGCEVLAFNRTSLFALPTDSTNDLSAGNYWYQRWGPAFNGLHSMLGFGSFGVGGQDTSLAFANNLQAPLFPIVSAWADAVMQTQPPVAPPNAGEPSNAPNGGEPIVAAAMGPIATDGATDFWDTYSSSLSGGQVSNILGPSIPPPNNVFAPSVLPQISGWWYFYEYQTSQ
jgi:hypothetical protein